MYKIIGGGFNVAEKQPNNTNTHTYMYNVYICMRTHTYRYIHTVRYAIDIDS